MYKKLRVCQRGISHGNSEVCKQATTFGEAKNSNFLYTMLWTAFFFWVNLFDRFFCHFYKFKLHKFIQKLKSILAWFNTSKFSFVAVGVNSDVFTFSFQSQFWRSIFHSRVNSDVCFFCVFSVFFIRFNFPKVDHNGSHIKKVAVLTTRNFRRKFWSWQKSNNFWLSQM